MPKAGRLSEASGVVRDTVGGIAVLECLRVLNVRAYAPATDGAIALIFLLRHAFPQLVT